MPTKNKQAAFTLVELVVVIIIAGIILSFSATLLMQGFRSYFIGRDIETARQKGAFAIGYVVNDIHSIASPRLVNATTSSSTNLTFTNVGGDIVSYSFNSESGQVIRALNYVDSILSDQVSSLNFYYYDRNGTSTTPDTGTVYYIKTAIVYNVKGSNYSLYRTASIWNYQ
jgi:prepilin-type N-terminal cleavage/methylation domain-containing protein